MSLPDCPEDYAVAEFIVAQEILDVLVQKWEYETELYPFVFLRTMMQKNGS
uniref:Uncharacterized protein n=1 Tax=Arundo donax TaxID=35708 RepID=A0A0A9DNE6_ARUDO